MTTAKTDGRPRALRLDQRYLQVPEQLVTDRMLHPIDKLIGVYLVKFDRGGYAAWPTNATLARALGCSARSVQYGLARLESAGWIERVGAPTVPRGNLIRLLWRRAGGRSRLQGGTQPVARGGTQRAASNPKFELKQNEEEGLLDPETLKHWTDEAAAARGPMKRFAAILLTKHAAALAALAQKERAPGTPCQVPEPAGQPPRSADAAKSTTAAGGSARHEKRGEHKPR